MTDNKKVTAAFSAVAEFISQHPDFAPENIEPTCTCILDFLKEKKLEVTVVNMNKALDYILETIRSKPDVTTKKTEAEQIADLYSYKAIIDGWSSSEMQEHMKDSETATAVENVLSEVAKLEAAKAQQPKPQPEPKPKFKPPVRTADEQALESMSADAFKAEVAKRGAAVEQILRGQR